MPFLGLGLSLMIVIYFSLHAYRTGRTYYWNERIINTQSLHN